MSDGPGTPDEVYGVYRNIAFDRSEKASDRISAADRLARALRLEIDGANGRQGASVAFQTLAIGSAEAKEMLQAVKTMAQGALRSADAPHEDATTGASSAPGDVSQPSSPAGDASQRVNDATRSAAEEPSAPPSAALAALQPEETVEDEPGPEPAEPAEPAAAPRGPSPQAPYVKRGRGRPVKPDDPDAPRGGIFRLKRDDDGDSSEPIGTAQPSTEQPSGAAGAGFSLVLPAGAFASDTQRGPVHRPGVEDDDQRDGDPPG